MNLLLAPTPHLSTLISPSSVLLHGLQVVVNVSVDEEVVVAVHGLEVDLVAQKAANAAKAFAELRAFLRPVSDDFQRASCKMVRKVEGVVSGVIVVAVMW